jgi:hypothetical protein
MTETVNHPEHYNKHPSGIECIEIIEHFNFNIGAATKHLWRAGIKTPDPIEDLRKAIWYVQKEIDRIETENKKLELRNLRSEVYPISPDENRNIKVQIPPTNRVQQVPVPGGTKPAKPYFENQKVKK